MEPRLDNTFDRSLEQIARRFEYPPTPDIAAASRPRTTGDGRRSMLDSPSVVRRLSWTVALIALAVAALFAIPQTRAAVLSFFARIGAIDIFIDETAPTPSPTPGPAEPSLAPSGGAVEHSLALFELGEPVGLDEARRLAEFALAVPAALGEPDEVYAHRNVELPAVTLVWRDEDGAPLSLTEIGIAEFAMKLVGEEGVRHFWVGDRPAVWLTGPHRLQLLGYLESGSLLIESNVLVWADGGVTYRLEGNLTQEEARAIAESLLSSERSPAQ